MTQPTQQDLSALQPEHQYFIGIDSDGCVFDSMELKHKECFCPAFVNHYLLQGACGAARETWEFVNLYSRTRGLNRFKAVVESMKLLSERSDVKDRVGSVMDTQELEDWIAVETKLGGPALAAFLEEQGGAVADDSILRVSLNWSNDVAAAVEKIVHDLPPIAEAVKALEAMEGKADCLVVSQTPYADLEREWREHGIDRFVRMIAAQEQGTKAEHLALAAGGKYAEGHVLMVGDAPGDHASAQANGFLYFPIVPGNESASWTELRNVGLEKFFSGTYAGAYQEHVLKEFYDCLPERPPWNR